MPNRPKILITNCVPLNGGDEALLRGLIAALQSRLPGSHITCLVKDLPRCRQHLPDLRLDSDLEFTPLQADPATIPYTQSPNSVPIPQSAVSNPHWFAQHISTCHPDRARVLELYRQADLILSAPGGFFHDHYPIEHRLRGLELALYLEKPTFLVGQSVGPFWKPESISRIREVFPRLTGILLRDGLSLGYLRSAQVNTAHCHVTGDIAFLLPQRSKTPPPTSSRNPSHDAPSQLALGLRAWPLKDKPSLNRTIASGTELASHLLSTTSAHLTLISTCQGIDGYHDDSLLSLAVFESLSPGLRSRVTIDRTRYHPSDLIARLGSFDAYISMRLHGCLLAMLAGTPALGIAYEPKTPEIFSQLGLSDFQFPFTAPAPDWLAAADRFLAAVPSLTHSLPDRISAAALRASTNLDHIAAALHPHLQASAA